MGKKRTNKVYSGEFKLSAVERMRGEKLGYRETEVLLGIGSRNGERLRQWERIYLEAGLEGLMKARRDKSTKIGELVGRPPKLDGAVEEDLIAENQRLRMENAYLKKLHALALSGMSEKETKPE